jgi:uncharacterized protein YPO0396
MNERTPINPVSMELFLQDQKRQDDDMRETRADLARNIGNVVAELRGLRHDTIKGQEKIAESTAKVIAQMRADVDQITDSLRVDEALKEIREKQWIGRREKIWAIVIGLILVSADIVIRVAFGL